MNEPRIRNFARCGSEGYNPVHPIKVYPIHSYGGGAIIRGKDGGKVGGGSLYGIRDTHGNYYKLLITPALYEDMVKSFHQPFGYFLPGKLFIEVMLDDFPDQAITDFKSDLFTDWYGEVWDDETQTYEDDYSPAVFKKHEYHKIESKRFVLALKRKGQFNALLNTLDELINDYKGKSTKDWNHVDTDPIPTFQYIFTFPEPWIVNRVFSPYYSYQGRFKTKDTGFEYAWYYGRYGIFEDWGDTTDYPHKYEHSVKGWDIGIKRSD